MKNSVMGVVSAVALLAVGVAQAGPLVDVTFKNLGREQAVLKIVTANESSTYQVANPKPREKVEANTSTLFRVQRIISPDVNAAMVRYTMGSKTCAFGTTFQMRMMPGGIKQPQWTKTATPSGGATCAATITSTAADYSWKVEFSMK
ncbi:hypothetical protein [Pseudomonas shirazensis]|uniref:hypothetical protein n=1 Tax=Pseudomonas shirazensis TaxID=2745494 RepID=UPI003D28A17D